MAWSLVAANVDGAVVAAALGEDGRIQEIDVLPAGITPMDVFMQWDVYAPILQSWDIKASQTLEGATIGQPLRYPRKLICSGAN